METDSSSACAASTTNSPGNGRRDTPSVRRVSPPGLRGEPFLRTGSHHRGRPTRDARSRPRLCGNSIEHCLPRNDILGQAHLCKFVPMRAATGRTARKPFFTNSGNKSFHAASALTCRSPRSPLPQCNFPIPDFHGTTQHNPGPRGPQCGHSQHSLRCRNRKPVFTLAKIFRAQERPTPALIRIALQR